MNATLEHGVLPTRNEGHGFHGTVLLNTGCTAVEANEIWIDASLELRHAFDLTAEQVRDYLDAVPGRHLADDLMHDGWIAGPIPDWVPRSIRRFVRASERD